MGRSGRTACTRLHARTNGYSDVRVTGRLDPSTAAIAMGTAALDWLRTLQDYGYLAIGDHKECFHSARPPIALVEEPP